MTKVTNWAASGHKPPIMLEVAYVRFVLVSRRLGVRALGPECSGAHSSDASRALPEAPILGSLTFR